MSINPNLSFEHFMRAAVEEANRRMSVSRNKKRKYYRLCGICGSRFEQSDGVRDNGSDTGWICDDCYNELHPEYEDFGEY